jgi:hypothetical protein
MIDELDKHHKLKKNIEKQVEPANSSNKKNI